MAKASNSIVSLSELSFVVIWLNTVQSSTKKESWTTHIYMPVLSYTHSPLWQQEIIFFKQ